MLRGTSLFFVLAGEFTSFVFSGSTSRLRANCLTEPLPTTKNNDTVNLQSITVRGMSPFSVLAGEFTTFVSSVSTTTCPAEALPKECIGHKINVIVKHLHYAMYKFTISHGERNVTFLCFSRWFHQFLLLGLNFQTESQLSD